MNFYRQEIIFTFTPVISKKGQVRFASKKIM